MMWWVIWILTGFVGSLLVRAAFLMPECRSWKYFKEDYCEVGILGLVGIFLFAPMGYFGLGLGLIILALMTIVFLLNNIDDNKVLFRICPKKTDA
jgi:hypothetical protein